VSQNIYTAHVKKKKDKNEYEREEGNISVGRGDVVKPEITLPYH
jgi:hypothetical protein